MRSSAAAIVANLGMVSGAVWRVQTLKEAKRGLAPSAPNINHFTIEAGISKVMRSDYSRLGTHWR